MYIVVACASSAHQLPPDPGVPQGGAASNAGGAGSDIAPVGGTPSVLPPDPTGGTSYGGTVSGQTAGNGGDVGGIVAGMMGAIVDPVPSASAEYISGSRIKTRYLNTTDGAKAFAGHWDEELQTECSFVPTQSGIRCLPTLLRAATQTSAQYADAACQTRVTQAVSCPPQFAQEAALAVGCASSISYTMFSIVGAHTGTLYQMNGDECIESPTQDGSSRYIMGAAIPLDSFALATVSTE